MNSDARGFTLIELLAAIAIFAVMAVMAYGGLSAVLRAHDAVELSLTRTAEIQKAAFRLQSDFEQARLRPVRDEYGDVQPAFISREEGRDGIARIEFTRGGARNPRLAPRSAFERVAYGMKDEQLLRYNWLALDRAEDEGLVELILLDGVESIEWRFLDDKSQWHSTWPPRDAGESAEALPKVVELTMVTKDWGELRYLFRLISGAPSTPLGPGDPDGEDGGDTGGDGDGDESGGGTPS